MAATSPFRCDPAGFGSKPPKIAGYHGSHTVRVVRNSSARSCCSTSWEYRQDVASRATKAKVGYWRVILRCMNLFPLVAMGLLASLALFVWVTPSLPSTVCAIPLVLHGPLGSLAASTV